MLLGIINGLLRHQAGGVLHTIGTIRALQYLDVHAIVLTEITDSLRSRKIGTIPESISVTDVEAAMSSKRTVSNSMGNMYMLMPLKAKDQQHCRLHILQVL
jgi:hypothetical protein